MFKCNKCGACCRNIGGSLIYNELDRGDGICKYLEGNLCSIYDQRPLMCRVDESYEIFWKHIMSIEDYYDLNYRACNNLKKLGK